MGGGGRRYIKFKFQNTYYFHYWAIYQVIYPNKCRFLLFFLRIFARSVHLLVSRLVLLFSDPMPQVGMLEFIKNYDFLLCSCKY